MKHIIALFFVLIPFLLEAAPSANNEKFFASVMTQYQTGAYYDAIVNLDKLQKIPNYQALSYYWKGRCFSQLQEYDDAIENFEKALRFKVTTPDLYYVMGQAYYAARKNEKAKEAFLQSSLKRFNVAESFFYIAQIDFETKNYDSALKYFKRVIEMEDVSTDLLQSTYFRLAESYLVLIERPNQRITISMREKVGSEVIPHYKSALSVKEDSALATTIYKRMDDVMKKYGIRRKIFSNGKPFPEKRFKLWLAEKWSYDTNVIQQSSTAEVSATPVNKDSMSLFTSALMKGILIHRQWFVFEPEILIGHSYYTRRDPIDSGIYKNDTLSITPAIRTRVEHSAFSRPAQFVFDVDYDNSSRRYQAPIDDSLQEFANTTFITVGEILTPVNKWTAKLKYQHKVYSNYMPTQNSKTNSIIFDNTFEIAPSFALMLYLQADYINAEVPVDNSNEFTMSLDAISYQILYGWDMDCAMTVKLIDTKHQRGLRGIEKQYSPGVTFTKTFNKTWDVMMGGKYTKKTSDLDRIYSYNQMNYFAQLKYNFY